MKRPGISDEWIREISKDDECGLTFCGALEAEYRNIAFYWNDETKRNYDNTYNKIILPALENHNNKCISEYTKEDFDDAILHIQKEGYFKNEKICAYAESTIRTYKQLMYRVVFYASLKDYCGNILWGTEYMSENIEAEIREDEKQKLKKSLTVKQEKDLAKYFFGEFSISGQQMGILLMYSLGLRNGEACGLNYGDIKPLQGHPECNVAWIYKSTIHSTSRLQSSGKTWNTGRLVPVPSKLLETINRRRAELEDYLAENNIHNVDIDQMPIACKGNFDNYALRCSAKDLTNASHVIFKDIGVLPIQLSYIHDDLSNEKISESVREKDATAYLLRRNYATHLQILGFNESEIQYLIGHDVENMYETRNEFMESERLFEIAARLALRPLVNDLTEFDRDSVELKIEPNTKTKIRIVANEPGDKLNIKVKGNQIGKKVTINYFSNKIKNEYERNIDVLRMYHRMYR